MIRLSDGPAAGKTLSLARAPLLLRVVTSAAGDVDGLDQPNDEPTRGEAVCVYAAVARPCVYHVSRRPRSLSGWYAMAEYRVLPDVDQPPSAIARNNASWRDWCVLHAPRLCAHIYAADSAAESRRSPHAHRDQAKAVQEVQGQVDHGDVVAGEAQTADG